MKLKTGDNVIVIAGKDKGKKGKITKVFPVTSKILVEGVNMKKKHQKARRSNEKGAVIDVSLPINVSNVMIVDPKSGKQSRVGKKVIAGKNVRIAKKSGQEI